MALFKSSGKKTAKQVSGTAGSLLGNVLARNARSATDAAVDGMRLFRRKINSPIVQNGSFAAQKGNLFEYIEAAKFNINAASSGSNARAIVTDAVGDPHAAADIIIKDKGRIVKKIQAKFIQAHKGGRDISAAKSVKEHTGALNRGWGQYDDMERLVRKQENYNENGSLLDEAKRLAKARSESGSIYAESYRNVYENLTDETHYKNVTSGGTTIEEVQTAYASPTAFARRIERKAVAAEMKCTAANMAKAGFITSGIVSGITNMFEVFRDEKELSRALCEVGAEAAEGAVRGAATGAVSTAIRYHGIKNGSSLLSDSTAATVMAGGLIDGGVALYSYARGEITAEELTEQLIDTTAKSVTTIYFTKVVPFIMGKAVSPIVPMVVYTAANYVITCTREIIRNAQLNAIEYDRMTSILKRETEEIDAYYKEFSRYLSQCEKKQKKMFDHLLDSFVYNLETGENYDAAIYAIVSFANEAGFALQHVDFEHFGKAMRSKKVFKLE